MSIAAIFEFLIVLGIMVLVHEFGHYAAAKLLGIRVETFSIGFGTRLFGVKVGDTDYRVCALPLGGYVKMSGDTPGQVATDPKDFNAHPRWHRMIVAIAGPVANFILAFLLVMGLNMVHHETAAFMMRPATVDYVPVKSPFAAAGLHEGDLITRYDGVENPHYDDLIDHSLLNLNHKVAISFLHDGKQVDADVLLPTTKTPDKFGLEDFSDFFVPRKQDDPIQISDVDDAVLAGSPAAQAGLQRGDEILLLDQFTPHSVEALLEYLQDQGGRPQLLTYKRRGAIAHTVLTAQQNVGGDATKFKIGVNITPPPVTVDKLSPLTAAKESAETNWKQAGLIKDVLEGLFSHRVSVKAMSGPIGIGQQVHQSFQMGGIFVVVTMAAISLNLGIFNLLPIPILDGGMILFLLFESVLRRDVNEVVKERVYQVAFVCIILFAAFIIFNDLTKIYGH